MDKTQLIGTLKSFGTKSRFIHLLFFKVGFKLSISAIIFANFISILFYLIQKNFKLFKLNKSNYYIDHIQSFQEDRGSDLYLQSQHMVITVLILLFDVVDNTILMGCPVLNH